MNIFWKSYASIYLKCDDLLKKENIDPWKHGFLLNILTGLLFNLYNENKRTEVTEIQINPLFVNIDSESLDLLLIDLLHKLDAI